MDTNRAWIAVAFLMLLFGTLAFFAGSELDPVRTVLGTPRTPGASANMSASAEKTVDFSDTDGPLISLRVYLAEDTASALDEVLIDTEILAHVGHWTTISETKAIRFPENYSPPMAPLAMATLYAGGGTQDDPNPTLPTATGDYPIPPHPENFREEEIGLTLEVRPLISATGEIKVETKLSRSALVGFVEDGIPLSVKTPKSPLTAPVYERKLDNFQRQPFFLNQTESLTFLESDERLNIAERKPDPLLTFATDFAEEHRHGHLPKLKLIIESENVSPPVPLPDIKNASDPQIFLTSRIIEITTDTPEPPSLMTESGTLFTDPQFQLIIRALNSKRGVDLVSAPSLMMHPRQMGTIEITREFIYPGDYSPPHVVTSPGFPISPSTPTNFITEKMGITVEAAARPAPDGMIDLQFHPRVRKHLDFLNFGEPISTEGKTILGGQVPVVLTENRIEQPVFSKWSHSTTVRLPDGSSILIPGPIREETVDVIDSPPFIGDLPIIGDAVSKRHSITSYRHLFIFLTPKLVDPTGKPLNPTN